MRNYFWNSFLDDALREGNIGLNDFDYVLHSDIIMSFVPAIIVSRHCQRGIGYLGFSSEEELGEWARYIAHICGPGAESPGDSLLSTPCVITGQVKSRTLQAQI